MADLTDLPRYADRHEVLRRSAQRLARGYYTNVVLSVYKGLRRMDDDRFLEELADGSPHLDWVLRPNHDRVKADIFYLGAILAAWNRADGTGLTLGGINHAVHERARDGVSPLPFDEYRHARLAARGGEPGGDASDWLAYHERAASLGTAIRAGVYADHIEIGRVPPGLADGIGAKALAVERSRLALDHHRRREINARTELGVQRTLAGAIEDSAGVAGAERAHQLTRNEVMEARHQHAEAGAEFDAALGPPRPIRRSPSSNPPRAGR